MVTRFGARVVAYLGVLMDEYPLTVEEQNLPTGWPWEDAWTTLFTGLCAPPTPAATT